LPKSFDRKRFLLCFALITILSGSSIGVARVATSLYAIDLQSTEAMLGVIAGSQSIGLILMALPVGILCDQFGPGRLFVIGSLFVAGLYLATPLVRGAEYLAACTALVSVSMPCRFVALNAVYMHQMQSIGLGRAGWFRGTHLTGFFLIGPALAVTATATLGFSGTFWAIAATVLFTALLAPAVMGGYGAAGIGQPVLSMGEIRAQLRLLRRNVPLRRVSTIEFFTQAAAQFYGFFFVVIAISTFRLTDGQAAAMVTGHGAAFVAALFLAGGAMVHLGQRRVALAGFLIVVASLAILGLAKSSLHLWSGSLLLGIGVGLIQTVTLARFAEASRHAGGGRIAGINALVGPAGGLIGCLSGGLMGHFVGLQAVFFAFVPAFAWCSWLVFRRESASAGGATVLSITTSGREENECSARAGVA
jgi:MFS family permease